MTAETPAHCDDAIDDRAQPECLRRFLRYARLPAVCKLPGVAPENLPEHLKWIEPDLHSYIWTDPIPELYATLKHEVSVTVPAPDWLQDRPARTITLPAGSRVRVVMASRLGDVGVNDHLGAADGYLTRLPLLDLAEFSAQQ